MSSWFSILIVFCSLGKENIKSLKKNYLRRSINKEKYQFFPTNLLYTGILWPSKFYPGCSLRFLHPRNSYLKVRQGIGRQPVWHRKRPPFRPQGKVRSLPLSLRPEFWIWTRSVPKSTFFGAYGWFKRPSQLWTDQFLTLSMFNCEFWIFSKS